MRQAFLLDIEANMLLWLPLAFAFASYDGDGMLIWDVKLVVAMFVTTIIAHLLTFVTMIPYLKMKKPIVSRTKIGIEKIYFNTAVALLALRGLVLLISPTQWLAAIAGIVVLKLLAWWMKRVDAELLREASQ